jgi:hypothetical protein
VAVAHRTLAPNLRSKERRYRVAAQFARARESAMRDMTDPRNIDRYDVGQTNSRSAERKSGVGDWLGVGLGIWSVVILVAIVFIAAIIYFAV